MKYLYSLFFGFLFTGMFAQEDSVKTHRLDEVIVSGQREHRNIERLPEVRKTFVWSGKKNEVINLEGVDANITEKTPRQIFSKVPGIFVYDMDGSGNQVNVSTRGLDAHRGWEFNIRRNGAITNSDMYGYPASHYSMPMEAVEKIELVRGTGSLQYGAQFGGMLNYISKKPDTAKAIGFETINSIGSFGLKSTYNAISGTVGKFQYYTYYSARRSDGYRDNSESKYDAQSVMLVYNASDRLKITGEISRSNYIYQIPGPLTDSMFHTDPTLSTRARNYFNPEIIVPSLTTEWSIGPRTDVMVNASAVLGDRNSVQFDRPATVVDAIDPLTLEFAPRQVDVDHFNSYTVELRIGHRYPFLDLTSTLIGGVQVMDNDLHRQQIGKGTTGTGPDFSLSEPGWGRDLHFKTKNIAVFLENNFRISEKLSINPGLRVEMGTSDMEGTISYYTANDIPNTIKHHFPLFGTSLQYALNSRVNFYGGWSQSYRPVIFKDIVPGSVYETVGKDLKDANGHNAEVGVRGSISGFRWDITAYQLMYNNRFGTQATHDNDGNFVLHRTNIGHSTTRGLEMFLQYQMPLGRHLTLTAFTSTAFVRAKYRDAQIRSGENNVDISGNDVESVPDLISRNGLTAKSYFVSVTFLYSYTAESFADPLNTVTPPANGAVGIVPAYSILDINSTLTISPKVKVKFNVNNAGNKKYFTKRPAFYPGPGIWTSDGKSFNISIGLKI